MTLKRRARVEMPSKVVVAPDGATEATVFSFPDAPARMQVYVTLTVGASRGGGGICVGNCSHEAIDLEWLDNRLLQITHPADLQFESRAEQHYQSGDIVRIVYRTKPS